MMRLPKAPESMDVIVTSQCNLRCSYCSHFSSPSDVSEELETDTWLLIFDELSRLGVRKVTLSGGEPFLRNDILNLIEGIVNSGMKFEVLSNGTLVTQSIANYLAKTNACKGVQISVDGSNQAIHESCRGRGSFFPALNGVRQLQESGVNVDVRVTIHKHNMNNMASIAHLLLVEYGLPGFSTNEASAMGMCKTNGDNLQINAKERSQVMRDLYELNGIYDGRITASAGPLAEYRLFNDMIDAKINSTIPKTDRGHLTGCRCIYNKLAIRSDGVLVPCVQLGHIELGRAGVDDLSSVWQSHPKLQELRNRRKIPLSQFEYCNECEYSNYCTGNCPAIAYQTFGKENHPSPSGCLHRFLQNGGTLPKKMNGVSIREEQNVKQ